MGERPIYLFYKRFQLGKLINSGENINVSIFATARDGINYRMNLDSLENYMQPREIVDWWKQEGNCLTKINVITSGRYNDELIGNVILERNTDRS